MQLQGVNLRWYGSDRELIRKGHDRGIAPFFWPALKRELVDLTGGIAHDLGFTRPAIRGGNNHPWTKPSGLKREIHLSLEKALVAYDESAESIGFTYGKKTGNWYQTLF